jgi:hypothetical protein
MREYQVRICERLRVKFPGPTRRWRNGLMACLVIGDAPVLSEVVNPSISRQDAPLRYHLSYTASRGSLPRERFSPLPQLGPPVGSVIALLSAA